MRCSLRSVLLLSLIVPAAPVLAQDLAVSTVLVDGENWQLVSEGHKFTEGPAADLEGNVYFTDIPNNRIHRIDAASGKVTVFAENTGGANGLMVGADGKLYACQNGLKQIGAYDKEGKVEVIVSDIESNDLVVAGDGSLFVTDPKGGRVWYVSPKREKRVVAEGLKPNGVILWRDSGTLVVTDGQEPVLWTFRVAADGGLSCKEPYYSPLQMLPGSDRPGSDGMTIDSVGRLYVATRAGLQMFDPTGRLGGAILKPQNGPLSNACFGGADLKTLYVTAGDKVFKRKTQAEGIRYFKK